MTPCRTWRGSTDANGYGRRNIGGKVVRVHRWVVAQVLGDEAIRGKVVMHVCDNPPCYRYDHLRVGTQAENNADKAAKGRAHRFERDNHPIAKLTTAQCATIRTEYADGGFRVGYRTLAQRYGVSHQTIKRIIMEAPLG